MVRFKRIVPTIQDAPFLTVSKAQMQLHYFHAVLKGVSKKFKEATGLDECQTVHSRIVLIFRYGKFVAIKKDSGNHITSLDPAESRYSYTFGTIPDLLQGKNYSRKELYSLKAHLTDRRGVSGNASVGADSVIVKNLNPSNGEADCGDHIFYYTTSRLGGAALYASYLKGKPIRVFRSSRGVSPYRPTWSIKNHTTMYGFGGLFMIEKVWSKPITDFEFLLSKECNPKDAVLFKMLMVDGFSVPVTVPLSSPLHST